MLLYKLFMSPITTQNLRKLKDKDDLLAGNLFARPGIKLDSRVYKSLLETIALFPKKKHLKKVFDHIIKYSSPEELKHEVL